MADLFGEWVPKYQIEWVLQAARCAWWHTFIFLTKNPKRLAEFNPWPDNCYVGMSCDTKQRMSDGYKYLCSVDAAVRFVSFEPLLERMDVTGLASMQWIIIGAQTNPLKLPERSWVEDIEREADAAGVPVFEKDSLAALFPERPLRREFPRNTGE